MSLRLELGVLHRLQHRLAAALDQVIGQLLELAAADRHRQVLGHAVGDRDERQVDIGLRQRAEFLLGLLARFLQPLQGHRVLAQIDAVLLLELAGDVVDQRLVEIVAAQVRIAVGADDLEDLGLVAIAAAGHLQHRHVERAAAEVEHDDLLFLLLIEAIGEGRRGRLVDDAGDFEAGDLARVLGRLPLGIVEVSRDSDDGLVDLVAEIRLRRFLELAKNLGRDFLRRMLLVADLDLHVVAARRRRPCTAPSSLRSRPPSAAGP